MVCEDENLRGFGWRPDTGSLAAADDKRFG